MILEWGDQGINVSELVVDHQAQKTHLGGTALVQLNSTLGHLGLGIERVPAKVNESVTEVTHEFVGASGILHESKFQESNKSEDLQCAGNWHGERGSPARSKVGELGARVVNVTRKVDASLVDKVSDNSKHANASMLDLNVSEAVKLFLVSVGDHAERIKETKRSLGTKLILKRHAGGDGRTGRLLRRGKGGNRGDEGGGNNRLHFFGGWNAFL
jgi:hypothetical protein